MFKNLKQGSKYLIVNLKTNKFFIFVLTRLFCLNLYRSKLTSKNFIFVNERRQRNVGK